MTRPTPKTFIIIFQNIKAGFQPKIKERKISICDKTKGVMITESSVGLITPSNSPDE